MNYDDADTRTLSGDPDAMELMLMQIRNNIMNLIGIIDRQNEYLLAMKTRCIELETSISNLRRDALTH